ncbi:MAG TPA: prephenate dehydrogenase/arogenate dehydrogenase family protein, partial [Gammaproteobacteria bacterium]|nr:prephenate dehydrogenase/arogenate dehydrogenase family protein [Gammaproteobacteria bacterium]
MFNRAAILGVGLIGGSMARAMKKHQLCREIIGYARSVSELEKALELGVIDYFETTAGEAVKDADIVIVAVPLGAFESLFRQIAGAVSAKAIITDVGSAKASV